MNHNKLYDQYDLLLPSKFDGGYLIIALEEKIKTGDVDGYFTVKEIDELLAEISDHFQKDSVRQWARIKDNLLHYFIRNHPEEPGRYFLTDYALSVIELMRNKLDNPYKKHPLKKSFEGRFFIRFKEIMAIEDLEEKFGRQFIAPSKKIVTDHLDGLEDELREAYKMLNDILSDEAEDAVSQVKMFALNFRKFGERAGDITDAMRTKDKFLKDLQGVVDNFYLKIDDAKFSDDVALKNKTIDDWRTAREIYSDIRDFFTAVDNKTSVIRRQINNASEKLSELQEYFSTRSNYRLQVQKILNYALQTAQYAEDDVIFQDDFPLKSLVYERPKMLYLKHVEFDTKRPNKVIKIVPDVEYEYEERNKIEREVKRQQLIAEWIEKANRQLLLRGQLNLDELIEMILDKEQDISIAYQVSADMISLSAEDPHTQIDIEQKLITLHQNELAIWKTQIRK